MGDFSDIDNIKLVAQSKVVMTAGSTAMIYPLLMDKILVVFDFSNSDSSYLKNLDDKLFVARSCEDVESLMENVNDKTYMNLLVRRQAEVRDAIGKFDGLSSERIIEEIVLFLDMR